MTEEQPIPVEVEADWPTSSPDDKCRCCTQDLTYFKYESPANSEKYVLCHGCFESFHFSNSPDWKRFRRDGLKSSWAEIPHGRVNYGKW